MQMNKRWLVLPLLLIICLPIFVVPASAFSRSDSDIRFSPIFWNFVQIGDAVYEFAGNVVGDEHDIVADFPGCGQVVSANFATNSAEVEFRCDYSSRHLSFTALSFILDTSALTKLAFTTFSGNVSLSVSWSADIVEFVLYNDKWTPSSIRSSGGTASGTYVDVADLIVRDLKRTLDSRFYLVRNFSLNVEILGDEFYDDWVSMRYNLTPNFDNYVGYAFTLDLPYKKEVIVDPANPNDVSFVDWLQVAVGGFLDFQLWPGFTLNQLIEFVVVIGIVLWFITLMI